MQGGCGATCQDQVLFPRKMLAIHPVRRPFDLPRFAGIQMFAAHSAAVIRPADAKKVAAARIQVIKSFNETITAFST